MKELGLLWRTDCHKQPHFFSPPHNQSNTTTTNTYPIRRHPTRPTTMAGDAMTASSSTAFAPPRDDDYDDNNLELWLLRAPAHLDVRALLDGATINVDVRSLLDDNDEDDKTADASSSSSSNLRGAATKNKNKNNNDGNLLSRFAATSDGSVYALSLSGSCVHGSDGVRLLVDAKPSASPSSDDDEGGDGVDGVGRLTLVPHRPFRRHVQLSSVPTVVAVGGGSGNGAPPPPTAPRRRWRTRCSRTTPRRRKWRRTPRWTDRAGTAASTPSDARTTPCRRGGG